MTLCDRSSSVFPFLPPPFQLFITRMRTCNKIHTSAANDLKTSFSISNTRELCLKHQYNILFLYSEKTSSANVCFFFFSSHWQDRIWTFFLRSRRLSLSFIFRTRVLFINYRGHRSFWPNFLVKIRFAWSSHYITRTSFQFNGQITERTTLKLSLHDFENWQFLQLKIYMLQLLLYNTH